MSGLGKPNGNGESDDDRAWREHAERFDAVQALERRLGSLETSIRVGFSDINAKLERLAQHITEQRGEILDLYKRLIDTDKRVDALEAKPQRGKKKR